MTNPAMHPRIFPGAQMPHGANPAKVHPTVAIPDRPNSSPKASRPGSRGTGGTPRRTGDRSASYIASPTTSHKHVDNMSPSTNGGVDRRSSTSLLSTRDSDVASPRRERDREGSRKSSSSNPLSSSGNNQGAALHGSAANASSPARRRSSPLGMHSLGSTERTSDPSLHRTGRPSSSAERTKSPTGGEGGGGKGFKVKDEEAERRFVQRGIKGRVAHPGPTLGGLMRGWRLGGGNYTEMSLITDHIAIGGREDACGEDCERLVRMGVTHILNAAGGTLPISFPDQFVYHKMDIEDEDRFPIAKHFKVASAFLSRVEGMKGRCLVHCIAGVSRSVTLVLAHLMLRHQLCLRDAYAHVHNCRPIVCPNKGFKVALAQLEVELVGATSVGAHSDWDFYEWNTMKNSYRSILEARAETDCCQMS